MAAVETTRQAPLGAITTYRAINSLSNVVSAFAAWNDALDDIGLCRGDIEFIGR